MSSFAAEYEDTSPTTNTRTTFINRHTPLMGWDGEGFLRKLMVKLVVTANGTRPMVPRMATYSATSATAMSTGPDTVFPGRSCAGPMGCDTVAERSPTSSTTH